MRRARQRERSACGKGAGHLSFLRVRLHLPVVGARPRALVHRYNRRVLFLANDVAASCAVKKWRYNESIKPPV